METLEERVKNLEKEFTELRAQILTLKQIRKDWRSTCGTLEADEVTQEAEQLGREYRQQTF
jgi:prefoldin subunit 5